MELTNKILKTPCTEFNFANPPTDPVELAKTLVSTMYENNGLGLSANQIGLNYKVFSFRGEPENFVAFNPKITWYSDEIIELEEGCLSFPGLIVNVKRPKHIRVRFAMPNGEIKIMKLTGMTARIFQHEMDHMEGKTLKNAVSKLKFDMAIKKAIKKGYKYNTNEF